MACLEHNVKEELNLEEIRQIYNSLIKNSQDLIYQSDMNGIFTFLSPAITELTGYCPKELIGKRVDEVLYRNPKDRQKFISKLKKNGSIKSFEAELVKKDGSIWWVSTNAHLIKNTNGKSVGIEGIARDISKRKFIEKSLLSSEKKYRELFEKSQDAILIIENGKFVDCNNAAVLMLKYKNKSKFLQTHPSQLSPEKQPDGQYSNKKANIMMSIALKNGSNRFEWYHKKANGEILPVEVLLTTITKEDRSQIIHTVWRDITERKKAEMALIESQRLGAIGEMASAVAHDFNNSLQSILGYIELSLRYPHLPKKLQNYINIMKKATSDAATRVQLLQRFGGKSKDKSNYTTVSINTIVSDTIKQAKPIWKDEAEKNGNIISIDVHYGDIHNVLGNEGELRTVMYNIVKNSIEAIKNDGTISITTWENSKDVFITIKDTGIGMNTKISARIFQPLFSSKGFELGRGYGMSGAYSIIKEHKGTILIKYSKPGKGTIIEVSIPITNKTVNIKTDKEPPVKTHKGIRILWVDDDDLIRTVIKLYMEELEIDYDIVNSGKEALNFLEKFSYNFVISDIGMPVMNGWELATEIKNRYKSRIKVAIVTGWGEQIDHQKKEDSGVQYIISKPITLDELKSLITKMSNA